MAETNPRFSSAQREALHAQVLTSEQLAEITSATILPADRTVVDNAPFVAGTTRVFPSGFLVDDVAPGTATENDLTLARVTPNRVMRTTMGNDTGTPVTYGAGAVAGTTPRITLASDDPAVVSLGLIDDWYEAARAKVNPIVGQAGIAGGTGVDAANAPRVSLATNIPLPAGTNYVGRVRSTDGTNDETVLFDVDSGAGTQFVHGVNLRRSAAGGSAELIGQGTMAQSVPMVLASDQSNVPINMVQLGGVAVAVNAGINSAGTQRVTLATDDPAVVSLGLIDDWYEAARAKVNPIVGQAGVQGGAGVSTALTQRVTLAGGLITLQASQVSAIVNGTTTRTTTTGLESYRDLVILLNITGGGAVTGTLQIFLQDSWDGGTTWDDLVASNTFAFGGGVTTQRFVISGRLVTTLTQGSAVSNGALAAGTVRNGPFGDRMRVQEVVSGIGGGPTGVTYTITCVAK